MPRIKIAKGRCKSCELCVIYCPKGLIEIDSSLNKRGYRVAKMKKDSSSGECTGCGFCAMVCPEVAIEVLRKNK